MKHVGVKHIIMVAVVLGLLISVADHVLVLLRHYELGVRLMVNLVFPWLGLSFIAAVVAARFTRPPRVVSARGLLRALRVLLVALGCYIVFLGVFGLVLQKTIGLAPKGVTELDNFSACAAMTAGLATMFAGTTHAVAMALYGRKRKPAEETEQPAPSKPAD